MSSVTAMNGVNGVAVSGNKPNSSSKVAARNLSAGRGTDGNTRSIDEGQRPLPQTSVWSKTSPLVHRPPGSQLNGIETASSGHGPKTMSPPPSKTVDMLPASTETASPDQHTGIFAGVEDSDATLLYTVKMTKAVRSSPTGGSGDKPTRAGTFLGSGPEHSMNFRAEDVVDLQQQPSLAKEVSPSRKPVSSSFRTDVDISGGLVAKERDLQKWAPGPDSGVDYSLGAPTSVGLPSWDQFETNERLFDVGTDYDENLYTTAIDRSNPSYRQQMLRADKLARDIERGPAANAHIAEERGLSRADDDGANEEDLYSGVRRQDDKITPLQMGQANTYLPPGRRGGPGRETSNAKAHAPDKDERARSGSRTQPAVPSQQGRPVPSAAPAVPRAPAPSISHGSAGPIRPLAGAPEAFGPLVNGPAAQITSSSEDHPDSENQPTSTKEKDVEFQKLLGDYRDFAKEEKLRMETRKREIEKNRRMKKEADRESRTAELKKFAATFKLESVPSGELLPILAKDPEKQRLITEKAEQDRVAKLQEKAERLVAQKQYEARIAAEKEAEKALTEAEVKQKTAKIRPGESAVESLQKSSGAVQPQGPRSTRNTSGKDQQPRSTVDPRFTTQPRVPSQSAASQTGSVRSPHALPQRPSISGTMLLEGQTPLSPTSAALRFNVQATEFRPNPAASSFKPPALSSHVSASSSRPGTRADNSPQPKPKKKFWGSRKPLPVSERPDIEDAFNPIKRMRREYEENKASLPAHHDVIKPAFTTDPLWGEPNSGKSYKEFYAKATKTPSPGSRNRLMHQAPQQQMQYQAPPGAQVAGGQPMISMPWNGQTAPQNIPYPGRQGSIPGMPQQFIDPRMAPPSPTTAMQSPHLAQNNFVYPGAAAGAAQIIYGQPMPQYGSMYNHPQYMHLRPHPGNPPMMVAPGTPQMGQQLLVQTMNGPQVVSVPQTPQMGYPQPMYGSPVQSQGFGSPITQGYPPGAYPSPRPAPLMMSSRQGSRQSSHAGQSMSMGMSPHQAGPQMYNNGGHPGQASMMRHYSSQFSGSPRMGNRFAHPGPTVQMPPGPHHSQSSQSYHSGAGGSGAGYGNPHGPAPSTPGSGHP